MLQNLVEEWQKLEFSFGDLEIKLLNKTEDFVVENFGNKHKYLKSLKTLFNKVDVHPFDSENKDELKLWHETKQKMIDFLQEIQK